MNEKILLLILLVHFLADFALQTHKQAKEKYKAGEQLFYHVFVYSIIWFFAYLIIDQNLFNALYFCIITFIFHWLTDVVTSNIGKEFWDDKDYHNGFVVIGFDQLLHYIQLYLTFKFLLT